MQLPPNVGTVLQIRTCRYRSPGNRLQGPQICCLGAAFRPRSTSAYRPQELPLLGFVDA